MKSNPDGRLSNNSIWWLFGTAILSMIIYLGASGVYFHFGFPLDDAWIHQTYARNLALHGEWSFIPGQPTGGSTSPLWTTFLGIGFLLKLSPLPWTFFLGGITLFCLSVLGELVIRRMKSSYHPKFPWVGVALALEWHLVWAAYSGMETILFALLVTAALGMIILGSSKYLGLGILIGLSVWVRPEGITLLGPAVIVILLTRTTWSKRVGWLINLGVGFGSLFALYLLFNLTISGSPLPNTFYAKQAEYADILKVPFMTRFVGEVLPVLAGMGTLLLPGVVLTLVSAIRNKAWGILSAAIWFLGFLGIYALRLPVTYQYGRYVMPAMPVFFLLGLAGLVGIIPARGPNWRWVLATAWKLASAGVLVAFWVIGAVHYARDVAFIESEMVATARWVSINIPKDELVATHDIGAMGYFGGHDLVDLAGLVSPEVIPFLRDETRLADYLNDRRVTYLITFPDWYQQLTFGLTPVYTTGAPFSRSSGGTNMTVYRWLSP